jgi:hypothetical protein
VERGVPDAVENNNYEERTTKRLDLEQRKGETLINCGFLGF